MSSDVTSVITSPSWLSASVGQCIIRFPIATWLSMVHSVNCGTTERRVSSTSSTAAFFSRQLKHFKIAASSDPPTFVTVNLIVY